MFSKKNNPSGFYVYMYIRKNGTPYYIGKGKGSRAWDKHCVKVPTEKRIIILYYGLTEMWSLAMERWYIRWYGRKDNGTGILRNLTDGGDGTSGMIPWNKNKKMPLSVREKMSVACTGRIQSKEMIENRANKNRGKKRSSNQLLIMSVAQQLRHKTSSVSQETKDKISKSRVGKIPWNKNKKTNASSHNAKKWMIINLQTDESYVIESLHKWCDDKNLKYKSVHMAMSRGNSYKKLYKILAI